MFLSLRTSSQANSTPLFTSTTWLQALESKNIGSTNLKNSPWNVINVTSRKKIVFFVFADEYVNTL